MAWKTVKITLLCAFLFLCNNALLCINEHLCTQVLLRTKGDRRLLNLLVYVFLLSIEIPVSIVLDGQTDNFKLFTKVPWPNSFG